MSHHSAHNPDSDNHGEKGANENTAAGLSFSRVFTASGKDPFDSVEWNSRYAFIINEKGEKVFEQEDVEAPANWSDLAVNVVASRYLRGPAGTTRREGGVRELISRVAGAIAQWGLELELFSTGQDAEVFKDELTYMLLHQMASFNSPVWFNVGVNPDPQCSACFILSVEDTMESILNWYAQEGMIFKGGSGAGVNVSSLRSAREPLSTGGAASGPISFMKAADASAGVIKSGGKTRRAAKMVILDMDHPDVPIFIKCKAAEEEKAKALIRAGFSSGFEGEAYSAVAFQNSNHSVRASDEFMEAVTNEQGWNTRFVLSQDVADTLDAKDLLRQIAQAAHASGDPGVQFHSTINHWHTCPNTGPIRASNPCSEYMQVDNSACNLASLKLSAFLKQDLFDTSSFRHAVNIMITAQDILVDKSSYPSGEIEKNAKNLRALGLGYADLGGLLMSMGVAYNSDEGRAWASTITALMTGQAYYQSSVIASLKDPFQEFELNREPMLRVIDRHIEHLDNIDLSLAPTNALHEAKDVWRRARSGGRGFGFRNCQVTLIAPTGTVAFMMDCDTTGVEPEIALVKYKTLSGGGRLRIVNKTLHKALDSMGYEPAQIDDILVYVEKNGTIEGAPSLAAEHLSVFDCAFRPLKGERFIEVDGHLKMMAAIQPFISGAISKTVNLPNHVSIREVEDIFITAWRMGLKAITVYRDGCKLAQPLGQDFEAQEFSRAPVRRRLPVNTRSMRHKFEIAGQKGYIHSGLYEDGTLGEIFIRMNKEGSTISGLMDTIATLTSIALQYGVPLEALVNKFSHVRFEPSGFTSNPDIPIAKSLTDYIFRYLGISFLGESRQRAAGLLPRSSGETPAPPGPIDDPNRWRQAPHHLFNPQSDAPACPDCGEIMIRSGACYECLNCGAASGCS